MDESRAAAGQAAVILCLLGLSVGLVVGAFVAEVRTERNICSATCGEHWTRESGGPCVCLEVQSGP